MKEALTMSEKQTNLNEEATTEDNKKDKDKQIQIQKNFKFSSESEKDEINGILKALTTDEDIKNKTTDGAKILRALRSV